MKRVLRKDRHLPIPRWRPDDQPREELLAQGAEPLPLSRLLAIILRTGCRGVTAEELSRRMLDEFDGLRGIDSTSFSDLCSIKGIGRAKAAQVKACLEIGKRLCREDASRLTRIDSPRRAVDFVALHYGPYLRDTEVEVACMVLLNRRRTPIRTVELARGGEGKVAAGLRQILNEAVKSSAAAIILVHNHPGGDCRPSAADLAFTREVQESCGLFGVHLLDHVIVGRGPRDFYSLADHGKLAAQRSRPASRSVPRSSSPAALRF